MKTNEQAEAFEKWWNTQEIPDGYGWSKPTFKGGFEVGFTEATALHMERIDELEEMHRGSVNRCRELEERIEKLDN